MVGIRQLPVDIRDAFAKLSAALASMRLALSIAARQASIAGRVALSAALLSIEQALVAIGSRLTSGIILVPSSVLKELRRAAGIPDVADAASSRLPHPSANALSMTSARRTPHESD